MIFTEIAMEKVSPSWNLQIIMKYQGAINQQWPKPVIEE